MEDKANNDAHLLELVIQYLKAIEDRKPVDEVLSYYHPDIIQTEYANTLIKNTVVRNIDDLRKGYLNGGKVLLKESYDIQEAYVTGNTVILEAIWTATIAIPIGQTPAGGQMKARFAQFYQFENGKIIRQRNYDCFDAF